MTARALLPLACAPFCGLLCGIACATAPAPASRELPTGLAPLTELLEGCAPLESADGQRFACAGDVEVATRAAPEGEPGYRAEARSRALAAEAQLSWDETVVPTEAESGLVERARAYSSTDDAPRFILLGATRTLEDGARQELWCAAVDTPGEGRCAALMGALLARRDAGALPAAHTSRGPVTAFGRALSVPTTCEPEGVTQKSGALRCADGVRVLWSAHASMDEAVQALQAQLDAAGDGDPGAPFACRILGETAQCETRARAIAGMTYLDGEAVAVACLGDGALAAHGACRALIHKS